MVKQIISLMSVLLPCAGLTFAQSGPVGYEHTRPNAAVEVEEENLNAAKAVDTLDHLDCSLMGIIKPRDRKCLVLDREQALSVLEKIPSDAYGMDEKPIVKKLLAAKSLKITSRELLSYRRVRSIQVRDLGIFSYPYFSCRFKQEEKKLFFKKTAGSQRKSGYIYENKPDSRVFLGGWSVNDDPETTYESENSVSGKVYKIGIGKVIMLFLSPDGQSFEIYELAK